MSHTYTQALSLNLGLTGLAGLAGQQASGILSSWLLFLNAGIAGIHCYHPTSHVCWGQTRLRGTHITERASSQALSKYLEAARLPAGMDKSH